MYVNPDGGACVAREGKSTNTAPARRQWAFDETYGTLSLEDGRQLYRRPDNQGQCRVAQEGDDDNTDLSRRTWIFDTDNGGIVSVVDGRQLYADQNAFVRVDEEDVESHRCTWAPLDEAGILALSVASVSFSSWAQLSLSFGSRFGSPNASFSSLKGKNGSRSPLGPRSPLRKSVSFQLHADTVHQLYADTAGAARVASEGQCTNTLPDRRRWVLDEMHGLLSLSDGRQLYRRPGKDRSCHVAFEGENGNTDLAHRTWVFDGQTGAIVSVVDAQRLSANADGFACVEPEEDSDPHRCTWLPLTSAGLILLSSHCFQLCAEDGGR